MALGSHLGGSEAVLDSGIGGIGWGLCWQEYWRRNKQYDMLPPHGARSKMDGNGNRWSVQPIPSLDGMAGETLSLMTQVAQVLGYDPHDPPQDAWLLHCQPNRGSYEIACTNMERAQETHVGAQKKLIQAQTALESARERNRADLVDKAGGEAEAWEAEVLASRKQFMECKAVIENAIQRYYLVPMEAFERFDQYGMPLRCIQATVVPQKRHQNLPDYVATEQALMPMSGEMAS